MSELTSISPLDGRYAKDIDELSWIFSEAALIKYRLKVEIEYFIALSEEKGLKEFKSLSAKEVVLLRTLYEKFDETEADKVKEIEKQTNHDVKAVEYYLKNELAKISNLKKYSEFIHFALTSEDINNLAYSLMLKDGVAVYLKTLNLFSGELKKLSLQTKKTALLALTHGQPASPTTLGKEMAVFYYRLTEEIKVLQKIKLKGKLAGAVGNWNAHVVAYPNIDWQKFSQNFITKFGLEFNPLTTQIESHDATARTFHSLSRLNDVLLDFAKDMWLYVSRNIFSQKRVANEVGSSTMPHKINPIYFENAEGNLGLANALFLHLAGKLQVSRLQRDLSDSTAIRNQGSALAYSLLAVKALVKGLSRVEANKTYIKNELNNHWELLAEPIQVVLRKIGYEKPYEALKELTRGREITKAKLHSFIKKLKISQSEKNKLLKLTPENYIGLAEELVEKHVK